jgi:hypothetical protein
MLGEPITIWTIVGLFYTPQNGIELRHTRRTFKQPGHSSKLRVNQALLIEQFIRP